LRWPKGGYQLPELLKRAAMLKVIPITEPGVAGFSYAIAKTDADETVVRTNAATQGLLAGKAMPTQPNPQFWSFIDHLKGR
jgi:hypothetical protein